MMDYLLTALASYLGVIAGTIIMGMALEEQKQGMKYFFWIQSLLVVMFYMLLFFFWELGLLYNLLLSVFVLLLIVFFRNKQISYMLFPLFPVFMYITYPNKTIFFLQASIVFLLGITSASMMYSKKNALSIILKHSGFVLVSILIYLLYFLK